MCRAIITYFIFKRYQLIEIFRRTLSCYFIKSTKMTKPLMKSCVLTCSRVNMPCVFTCSRTNVPCVLRCSRTNVPCVYVLTCQLALRAYVLTCLRANVPCLLMCSRSNVLCVLTCSRVNVPCVLFAPVYLHAHVL